MADTPTTPVISEAEPRWPAVIAVLAVAGLYLALPSSLAVGPRWLQPCIIVVLLVPTIITHHARQDRWNRILGHAIALALTVFMIWSLGLLMAALPAHKEAPTTLLRSGGAMWVTNILVFALWYWRLDAGGPHSRAQREHHTDGAFLFPQMTMKRDPEARGWSPRFIDYLFLAFNTSTALSPTDVPILSRWAKVMVMIQALISLSVIAILVARGVNML